METQYHQWIPAKPEVKIKLEKNTRGHSWEITYSHENRPEVLRVLREVNESLVEEYGGGG